MRVRQYSPRRLISKAAIRPRDGMLQTSRVQPLRSLARSASIITLTILSLTTCELGKLFGPTTPPATKLVFQVQPQSALAGVAFTSAVKVYVSDALGDTVIDATNAITIGITPSTGTAGAILNGTTTASATAGVATFTNINVDRAGTGYTLTASATPLTPAVSSAFVVVVPPTIVLTPSSRAFTATVGGASPAPLNVAVTNSGGSTLAGLAIGTITYGAGGTGWLAATITPATAPATVTLTATTGALAVGTYTATVPVTSTTAGVTNSPQNIAVTFTVTQTPTIALNPTSRTFTSTVGSNPGTQTVAVTNSSGGTLSGLGIGTITYGAGGSGWLAATLDVTTAPATVTLIPTTTSLGAGTYTATVPVTSTASGVTNSPQNISVTLTVSAATTPAILLNPSSRTFNGAPGGGNPGSQSVAVTNSGIGTLSGLTIGTITYGAGATGWVTAALDVTTAPATVTLAATTGALAAGTYTATVPVTAAGVPNSPQNISVTFTIATPTAPLISLNPTSLKFSGTQGAASPAAQTVSVTNTGVGTLSGLSTGTITYGAGATGWLAAGLSGTTAPATITLTPTTTSLAAGTYTATVPVAATGAGNSPQSIAVTLTVAGVPTISLVPTSRTFTTSTGTNPATQNVGVANSGSGTLNGLAIGTITYSLAATGWLAAALDVTTAPATVTLSPTTSSLAAGTYTATVPVTSSATGVTNSPQNISVTVIVSSQGSNTWATLTAMTNARWGPAAEAINGVMYVAGGNGGTGDTPSLQAYTVASGAWAQLTNMTAGRYQGDGGAIINNELYVPGGWTTSPGLPNNNLFIYTPSTNAWRSGANMLTLSGCGGNGVINNKLYVTTACDGSAGYRSFLHVYDPIADTWASLTSTASAHSGPAAGVIGGKLYVAGGFNGTAYSSSNTLEVYDPVATTWSTKASMTVGREGAVGAVVNGKLYVIGGSNGAGTALNTVEVYDPVANTWATLAPMTTARTYASVAVINGYIYVVGGQNAAGTALSTLEVYRP